MAITRRSFLQQSLIYGAGVGVSAFPFHLLAQAYAAGSPAPDPETKAYKKDLLQLMLKYEVAGKSRFLKIRRPPVRAHVLKAGKGAPVVLLHGGGTTAANLVPVMSALQQEHRLLAPDRPGCGLSGRFNYRDVPFREHAIDFVTGIFEGLRLKKASLIANSMGGYWALAFALARPERVDKLVLMGEPAGSSPPGQSRGRSVNKYENTSLEVMRKYYEAVLVSDVNRVPIEMLQAEVAAARLPGAALAWTSMLEQLKKENQGLTYALRPELKQLRAETLFIWGDKDFFGPPTLGQEMAAMALNARCEIIPDAGHMPWLDQPERCAELTRNFLNG